MLKGYLADSQIELTFQTAFREGGTPDRPSVAMYLSKHPNSRWQPLPGAVELSVSAALSAAMVVVATHELLQWLRRGGGGEGVLV